MGAWRADGCVEGGWVCGEWVITWRVGTALPVCSSAWVFSSSQSSSQSARRAETQLALR